MYLTRVKQRNRGGNWSFSHYDRLATKPGMQTKRKRFSKGFICQGQGLQVLLQITTDRSSKIMYLHNEPKYSLTLWNPNVQYRTKHISPLDAVLIQLNSVHTFTPCLSKHSLLLFSLYDLSCQIIWRKIKDQNIYAFIISPCVLHALPLFFSLIESRRVQTLFIMWLSNLLLLHLTLVQIFPSALCSHTYCNYCVLFPSVLLYAITLQLFRAVVSVDKELSLWVQCTRKFEWGLRRLSVARNLVHSMYWMSSHFLMG
jgi:hypothetical protein